ncbi:MULTISPECIES: hypothetical protein [unclassified Pseudofrankia]|uniref:hypothetical protein n=1 Tax=unclassified Pseudofrankia TaxID=2994372 RepID=UPI0008D90D8B|nr:MULTISPECIES: hypothetical protein [unclassified Pseudofrankia]MDT3438254.1 hypothetical protein [Pseudofrankia sp. BMG5.37]OHV46020.1 hypothetical protein BCD48_20950 [Pseudofrankia sp. BMG5.36]
MNGTDLAAMHAELRSLARGRGLRSANLDARTGPLLRRYAALGDLSGGPLRSRMVSWLGEWLGALPEDLRLVAGVSLGVDPRAGHRLLTERLSWLAVEFERDPRTLRRRGQEAFRLLAEMIIAGGGQNGGGQVRGGQEARRREAAAAPDPAGGTAGWYVERVWALMRLDAPTPELLESRRIVAVEDGLREVALSMSLPRPPDAPPSPRDLGVDVMFGGRIVRVDRRGDTLFSPVLRLPHPLGAEERHEFGCVWRVPPGQPMVPHYAMNPTIRCDALDLRVRFPEGAEPKVHRLDGLPLRAVEDLAIDLPVVPLDGAGEVSARFGHLGLGLSYGLRWT